VQHYDDLTLTFSHVHRSFHHSIMVNVMKLHCGQSVMHVVVGHMTVKLLTGTAQQSHMLAIKRFD